MQQNRTYKDQKKVELRQEGRTFERSKPKMQPFSKSKDRL